MKKMDRKKLKRIKTSHRFWQLAMRRSAKKNRTSVADHSVGNRKSLMVFIRRFVLMISVQRYPFSYQMHAHFYLVRPLCTKCSPKTCLSGGRKGRKTPVRAAIDTPITARTVLTATIQSVQPRSGATNCSWHKVAQRLCGGVHFVLLCQYTQTSQNSPRKYEQHGEGLSSS